MVHGSWFVPHMRRGQVQIPAPPGAQLVLAAPRATHGVRRVGWPLT